MYIESSTETKDNFEPGDLALILGALEFAAHKHRNQRRKDVAASPYINHCIAVANLLVNEGGVFDRATVCAALLHDTIEDTETTSEELSRHFGGVQLPPEHLVTVATANRVVISRSHEAAARVGQDLPPLTGSDRPVGPGRWVASGPTAATSTFVSTATRRPVNRAAAPMPNLIHFPRRPGGRATAPLPEEADNFTLPEGPHR